MDIGWKADQELDMFLFFIMLYLRKDQQCERRQGGFHGE